MLSFADATQEFIDNADWLTAEDAPAVMALIAAAAELDRKLNPPLLAQYRMFYSGLMKKAPQGVDTVDPLEEALQNAAG